MLKNFELFYLKLWESSLTLLISLVGNSSRTKYFRFHYADLKDRMVYDLKNFKQA